MKNRDILHKIGLGEKEVKVYTALAKSGPLTISALSEKTGIHRPLLYKTLPLLQEKGLVTLSPKGKQKRYVAESPDKLKAVLGQLTDELEELIPELKSTYQASEKKPLVKYFEGSKGIRFVFEDLITTLKRGDIFYRYSSAKNIPSKNEYLPHNYREARDKKQLERFVITNKVQSEAKKPRLERDIKVIPPDYDLFDYDVTQIIYGDKVAFIDYNSETAVIIENKIIANFQSKIFKLLYRKL